MTLNEIRNKRPEGWKETTELYLSRQINSKEACKRLGISSALFFRLLHRDNPGRKNLRAGAAQKMGKANKKYSTYLEQNFSDYTLCKMIRLTENCAKCPCNCDGQKNYKELRAKLLQLVPIAKTASETSEDT